MKQVLAVLLAANVLAPSGILAAPAKFERQNVTVLGIIEGISAAQISGGWITQFALCDSRCINVVEFSKPSFSVGSIRHGHGHVPHDLLARPHPGAQLRRGGPAVTSDCSEKSGRKSGDLPRASRT